MQSVFFDSLLVEPPTICGLKMQPLSCWHAAILMRLDSPFVVKNKKVNDADVLTLLLICMDTKKDKLRRFLLFSNSALYRLCWRIRCGLMGHKKLIDGVDNYIRFYSSSPKIWESGEGKKAGTPFPFRFVCTVAAKLHKDWDEVWDWPLCLVQSCIIALAESDGLVDVAEMDFEEMRQKGII